MSRHRSLLLLLLLAMCWRWALWRRRGWKVWGQWKHSVGGQGIQHANGKLNVAHSLLQQLMLLLLYWWWLRQLLLLLVGLLLLRRRRKRRVGCGGG